MDDETTRDFRATLKSIEQCLRDFEGRLCKLESQEVPELWNIARASQRDIGAINATRALLVQVTTLLIATGSLIMIVLRH